MNARIINRIARTELATLFYSPVAWILLVVLCAQIGSAFIDILGEIVRIKVMGRDITFSVTSGIVLGHQGIYEVIQNSLYLYIPLLTMNLMSREYSSGSDKLLYSSPVSSLDIVLGKYLSMTVCCLLFTFILGIPAIATAVITPNSDIPLMLSCLLGMFFIMMTYSSIGLFMSSLTSYQVVAALATLATLAVLNFIDTIGQNSPLFKELTYWLSIKGRASTMVGGLICSDDVIYFVSVSAFFLMITATRLKNLRASRRPWRNALIYSVMVAGLVMVGALSSRPALKLYYDATQNKIRTLAETSQQIIAELDGPLSITTYVDVQDPEYRSFVPAVQMRDKDRFAMYTRFKPEIKMDYVYYYSPITDSSILAKYPGKSQLEIARRLSALNGNASPHIVSAESLKDEIDLSEEKYEFVRVLRRANGRESRLRIYNDMLMHPSEKEITAAMKQLAVEHPVKIAVLTGHGERSIYKKGDRDFNLVAATGKFRSALINQGFSLVEVNLAEMQDIPADCSILFIPDPLNAPTESELSAIDRFVERGGNMFILTDQGHQNAIGGLLKPYGIATGADMLEGVTVPARATAAAADSLKGFYSRMHQNRTITAVNLPGAASLRIVDTTCFKALPLLTTDTTSTGASSLLAVSMRRDIPGGKQQRIVVVSDADCFSNSFLSLSNRQATISYNFDMLVGTFRYLCYGEFPVTTARAPYRDREINLSLRDLMVAQDIFNIGLPALIALIGLIVILLRKRR